MKVLQEHQFMHLIVVLELQLFMLQLNNYP